MNLNCEQARKMIKELAQKRQDFNMNLYIRPDSPFLYMATLVAVIVLSIILWWDNCRSNSSMSEIFIEMPDRDL